MPNEPENNNVEVTPEWAKQLQESLSRLPQQIAEALTPENNPDPEPSPIPVPQPPEPQNPPEPEPLPEPQPEEPEPPKKKKFLDWLL